MRIGRSEQILGLFTTSFKSFNIAERPWFYFWSALLLSWVLYKGFSGEWEHGVSTGALLCICGAGTGMSRARKWGQGFEPELIPIHSSSHQLQTGTREGFLSR